MPNLKEGVEKPYSQAGRKGRRYKACGYRNSWSWFDKLTTLSNVEGWPVFVNEHENRTRLRMRAELHRTSF